MRIFRPALAPAAALFALLVALPAHAVSNRIFMSTNGNNANDCANPLTPCLTFAGALAQVNPGGEVIAEATGGYGALNITQAVTISGPPGVVIYSGLSVTVNAPGAVVVLRGLTIDGTGALANGINVTAVESLLVDRCVISGFTGANQGGGNGIFFAAGSHLSVEDTIVTHNTNVGIWTASSSVANTSIDRCRLEGNFIGLRSLGTNSAITVHDCVSTDNSGADFIAEGGGELDIENCVASGSGVGIESLDGTSLVRVSNTTVTQNTTGLGDGGGILLSRGNNTVQGNGTKGVFTGTFSAD